MSSYKAVRELETFLGTRHRHETYAYSDFTDRHFTDVDIDLNVLVWILILGTFLNAVDF